MKKKSFFEFVCCASKLRLIYTFLEDLKKKTHFITYNSVDLIMLHVQFRLKYYKIHLGDEIYNEQLLDAMYLISYLPSLCFFDGSQKTKLLFIFYNDIFIMMTEYLP